MVTGPFFFFFFECVLFTCFLGCYLLPEGAQFCMLAALDWRFVKCLFGGSGFPTGVWA